MPAKVSSFLKQLGRSKSSAIETVNLQQLITDALSKVIDPDLNKDIVSLGFVKQIEIKGDHVNLRVELTTPACPAKDLLRSQITEVVRAIDGISQVHVEFSAQARSVLKKNPKDTELSLGLVKNIIGVASGKGGVGKSTTTINLAYALSKMGAKVGILDADVHGPSMSLMSNAENPTQVNGEMVVPPVVNGVKIMSAAMFLAPGKANIMRGPMMSQIIKQFLCQVAWGELDYLIVDYPPGTGDVQLSLSQLTTLTGAVIVTTPQEVALLDVRKAIEMFSVTKVPVLGVIETMSYFVCDSCDKKHPIFGTGGGKKIADEIGVKLLGEVPLDQLATQCSDSGKPVVLEFPKAPISKIYDELAGAVASQVSILNMALNQSAGSMTC